MCLFDIETHLFPVLRDGAQPNVVDGRPDETDVDQREAKRCVWSRTVDEQPSRYGISWSLNPTLGYCMITNLYPDYY